MADEHRLHARHATVAQRGQDVLMEQEGIASAFLPLLDGARFGRMFRLPRLDTSDADIASLATAMAAESEPRESAIPAGYTYFGQFVDHDITLDTTPLTDQERDPRALESFRTPALDLDSAYGSGPHTQPYLYGSDGAHLRLQVNAAKEMVDLLRLADGAAVIGDPRNDENLIVAQMHAVVIKFHNRMVDHYLAQGDEPPRAFARARRSTQWHYQWVVIHDFCRRIAGDETVNDILRNGRRFYRPGRRMCIPVEFSVAAYRFGHSMVRNMYEPFQLAPGASFQEASLAQLFQFANGNFANMTDLNWALRPQDWAGFLETRPAQVQPQGAAKVDHHLATILGALPHAGLQDDSNLASRNLRRSRSLGLPAGQAVATAMGANLLTESEVRGDLGNAVSNDVAQHTPLWFYILREADAQQAGDQLGQVGGRIVAEVFIGLVQRDPTSFWHWRWPFFPIGHEAGLPNVAAEVARDAGPEFAAEVVSVSEGAAPTLETVQAQRGRFESLTGGEATRWPIVRRWAPWVPTLDEGHFQLRDFVNWANGVT